MFWDLLRSQDFGYMLLGYAHFLLICVYFIQFPVFYFCLDHYHGSQSFKCRVSFTNTSVFLNHSRVSSRCSPCASLSRQVSSGHLLAVVSQHYQPVAVLRFTDDGTHFISGGSDARVIVWRLGRWVCTCTCMYVCTCTCMCVCGII